MRTFVRWLLRSWVQLCRLLLHWLRPRSRPYWPSPRVGGPIRRPHAPPKPRWVRDEVIRLKALLPAAGCRTIAHHFNRRWTARRQMTVGKTYVAATLSRSSHLILHARRTLKHRRPRPLPRNFIWGCDLLVRPDGHGRPQFVLAMLDHASRACLCLQRLPEKSSLTLLRHLLHTIRHYGTPRFVRTDNEACFTSVCFRLGLRLLGIIPQRIVPGCPWQNGRVERFFGTLKATLSQWPTTDGEDLDQALVQARRWYNHQRPHDHLHGRTPAEVWAGVDVFASSPQRTWTRVPWGHARAQPP
jgi:putative transposase